MIHCLSRPYLAALGNFRTISWDRHCPNCPRQTGPVSYPTSKNAHERPATNVFQPETLVEQPPISPAGMQTTTVNIANSMTRLAERHLNRSHWHRKKPTTTILYRETVAVTKSRVHSTFQPQKDGSLMHSHKFFKHILPTPSTTSSLAPSLGLLDKFIPDSDGCNFPLDIITPSKRRTAGVSGPWLTNVSSLTYIPGRLARIIHCWSGC